MIQSGKLIPLALPPTPYPLPPTAYRLPPGLFQMENRKWKMEGAEDWEKTAVLHYCCWERKQS